MYQQTSLFAYKTAVLPTLGEKQREVLSVFENNEYHDWTNMELAEQLAWGINRVTPRVKELRDAGFLEEKEKRTCNVTGMRVIAWGLKERLF